MPGISLGSDGGGGGACGNGGGRVRVAEEEEEDEKEEEEVGEELGALEDELAGPALGETLWRTFGRFSEQRSDCFVFIVFVHF